MSFLTNCIKLAKEQIEYKTVDPWEEKETTKRKLRKRCNSLETQVAVLESAIKDELYKEFMAKLGEPAENQRLKKENKRLRLQIKSLKEIIKENNA